MAERVHCGTCGSDNRARAVVCWFCGDAVVEVVTAEAVFDFDRPSERSATSRGLGRYGLVFLSLATVAMCGLAFYLSTGLGITVTLLATPALIQTARAVEREEARGRTVTAVQKTGAFVRSLLIGIAARAAGFATFLVVLMMGMAAGKLVAVMLGYDWMLQVGGFIGAGIGAVAGFWVAVRINRQRVTV